MLAKKHLFVATTLVEAGAGLALLFVPRTVLGLLLAIPQPSPEALLVGKVGGAALLAIGISCWLARDDRGSPSQHGLLCGMLVYNVAVCVLLGYAGSMHQMVGVVLWPAVVLHTALAIWCALCLWAPPTEREVIPCRYANE